MNDLKNCERAELQACVSDLRKFNERFSFYYDETELIRLYREQEKWQKDKKKVLEAIYKERSLLKLIKNHK